jgi:hypothetical protein
MKKMLIVMALLVCSSAQATPTLTRGAVAKTIDGCDYYLAESNSSYYLLKHHGGHQPEENESVVGMMDDTGFSNVLYNGSEPGRVYVEDYLMNHEEAMEKLIDVCK